MKKFQIFCSTVNISVRFEFRKLPTTVSLFNFRVMKRASVNYAFVR